MLVNAEPGEDSNRRALPHRLFMLGDKILFSNRLQFFLQSIADM
ncbi:hypothetical protein CJA_0282 [Cellvibrio japonicus Ueda107]|uniref:Uncharacterized protein n=1 Tax=Cellvibrio japonicus (strain Ueda107) TaxID=498211 RepID=B3PH85_CELJU|nr:hypothetical protein CJA_0282 [Cellvibrio japonicus Ueda107]